MALWHRTTQTLSEKIHPAVARCNRENESHVGKLKVRNHSKTAHCYLNFLRLSNRFISHFQDLSNRCVRTQNQSKAETQNVQKHGIAHERSLLWRPPLLLTGSCVRWSRLASVIGLRPQSEVHPAFRILVDGALQIELTFIDHILSAIGRHVM